MSYDIDLVNPADRDDRYAVGNYTSNVVGMWTQAFARSNAEATDLSGLHGFLGRAVDSDLALAAAHMLAHPDLYTPLNPPNGWGCYEGATEYLVKMWLACRKRPGWEVQICY